MPVPTSKFSNLLAELRRRRVFRVAVVYAGVAFIVIQIIDGAFDYLKIPEWIGSLIIIMLAVGFPIAVGMAWAFDLTAEGLVRAKPKREPTEAKAPHHIVIGNKTLAIVAALAVIAAAWSWWGRPGQEAAMGESSIAVLPFINMSADPEQEYFCDGITDDILTHLCKIGDLNVIARTSSMQYKGTDKRPREIGQELGVATILEGSVRRYGNKVRIVAQLVEARTGKHLWADDYDRDLTDIFAIQSDVAQQIAAALKATLTPEEKNYIEQKPTASTEAYNLYLKGLYFWNKRTGENILKAKDYFQQAIEIDPLYARAYVGLADCYNLLHEYADHPSKETYPKARAAALKSLEIDPKIAEAHTSLAYAMQEHFWDWEGAEREQPEPERQQVRAGHRRGVLRDMSSQGGPLADAGHFDGDQVSELPASIMFLLARHTCKARPRKNIVRGLQIFLTEVFRTSVSVTF